MWMAPGFPHHTAIQVDLCSCSVAFRNQLSGFGGGENFAVFVEFAGIEEFLRGEIAWG